MKPLAPLIVEPDELEPHLGDESLLIVDLGPQDLFDEAHVPCAIHLDSTHLVSDVEPELGGR
ncbi:MAG: sulfurtransferase, partial [Gammaproteobacteria bacterium]|nr:sulfurtransferase [Gammaproteobacteria bacterium]